VSTYLLVTPFLVRIRFIDKLSSFDGAVIALAAIYFFLQGTVTSR
jgi:hypothetical protein